MDISDVEKREARPPYVVFERRAVEDREASLRENRYVAKDVDFAIITPIGSKDRIPRIVSEWFDQLEVWVRQERFDKVWLTKLRENYALWKKGEEPAPNGTPIRGWPMVSPAQAANIISANVLTVEDLAQANDEARHRIGMGSLDLVNKAAAWVKAQKDHGPLVTENAKLRATLSQKDREIESLREALNEAKVKLAKTEKEPA